MSVARFALNAVAGFSCLGLGVFASTRVETPSLKAALDASLTPLLSPKPIAGAGSVFGSLRVWSLADARPGGPANALDAISAVSVTPANRLALAYANDAASPIAGSNPILATPPAILVDPTGVREAIAAYRSGDIAAGDAAAATTQNDVARAAVDWAALRLAPRAATFDRIAAFMAARPDWPAAGLLRRRAEEALWIEKRSPSEIQEYFETEKPRTPLGKMALARALLERGWRDTAATLAREIWREANLSPGLETTMKKEFGDLLTKADYKFRSDRLSYKGDESGSMRIAALAGPDILALAKARADYSDKIVALVPAELRKDPSLIFAKIQKLRRDDKIAEAAQEMLAAPRDPELLVNPDEWWIERRMLARKLLDLGDPKTAWRLCAEHSAAATELRIDAEFTAGWIALRYLSDPALAEKHFAAAAAIAVTPISIARAAYWRGRAAEAANNPTAATQFYQTAAAQPSAFYGQLALAKLGRDQLPVRRPAHIARGDDRIVAVRVVELLEALDEKDIAAPLAIEMARTMTDEAQIAALGDVVAKARDARLTLVVGKAANQRGFAMDEIAYPTFGVPLYDPVVGSAPAPIVYAIARQESAFDPKAVSSAGAKGLMQMIVSTARRTAMHAGLPFDESRLLTDPAFNARLGAAHLGELFNEHRGSLILSFAAYNAGGKRVKEWIAAHGDPRDPNVDPIDWIERIPIAETRNYVQRIAENVEMYRALLGDKPKLSIETTLREAHL